MKRKTISKLVALSLITSATCSLPAIAVDLPPLPEPTLEQLENGRKLLDKIADIVAHVPLKDEVAVMKALGFTNLKTGEYSDHRWVVPAGKTGSPTSSLEMAVTGFSSLRLLPWIKSSKNKNSSSLNASLAIQEACISLADTQSKFTTTSKTVRNEPTIYAHAVNLRAPVHDFDNLIFDGVSSTDSKQSILGFRFEFQTCAKSFFFVNQIK